LPYTYTRNPKRAVPVKLAVIMLHIVFGPALSHHGTKKYPMEKLKKD